MKRSFIVCFVRDGVRANCDSITSSVEGYIFAARLKLFLEVERRRDGIKNKVALSNLIFYGYRGE
jgi:hypothetical protein